MNRFNYICYLALGSNFVIEISNSLRTTTLSLENLPFHVRTDNRDNILILIL